jgi:hypothetical protein
MTAVLGTARADFTERTRRFSFIALMAAALFAAFWFVPRTDGSMQVMVIDPMIFFQGDNPSWIPVTGAWGLGFFLPLIGFFYLRNALAFDERTGVSQLISASPVSRFRYMLGKLLSGTLILYCASLAVIVGSFFMMIWRFPGQWLSPSAFLTPFIFLLTALPFCAALALLFESVRFLRGAIGSTLYIVGFITILSMIAMDETSVMQGGEILNMLFRVVDVSGASVVMRGIYRTVLETSGQPLDQLMFLGGTTRQYEPTFSLVFNGIPVTADDLIGYAGMLCLTLAAVAVSAPMYNLTGKKVKLPVKRRSKPTDIETRRPIPVYVPLKAERGGFLRGVMAELKLMLNGQALAWKLVVLGGLIACVFAELSVVQKYILPLLMVWFINVFSGLGSREHQHGVLNIISVIPGGRFKQVTGSWLSGFIITLALFSPVAALLIFAGNYIGLFAGFAGAVFLPSFAMLFGEFTKTRRAFELAFVLITYLIMNNVPALMYMGGDEVTSLIQPAVYLALGLGAAALAMTKRSGIITLPVRTAR